MSNSRQRRGGASAPAPSQTVTQNGPQQPDQPRRTLRLRGARTENGRNVQWADDVIDNEGLGRKRSKVCCIYHRPKAVDESSDESSSDSSDESSDDGGGGDADRKGKGRACGHDHGNNKKQPRQDGEKSKRAPSPNAYEKLPKPKPKEPQEQNGGNKA